MPKISFAADPDPDKNAELNENSVNPDPFLQFSVWFRDAVVSGVAEPEAMFLATVGENGKTRTLGRIQDHSCHV